MINYITAILSVDAFWLVMLGVAFFLCLYAAHVILLVITGVVVSMTKNPAHIPFRYMRKYFIIE